MLSHIRGIISSFSLFFFSFFVSPLKSRGLNSSLEAQIPISRPKSKPFGLNPKLKAQILVWRPLFQPWDQNLNLNVQIPAKRPRSQPRGPILSLQARLCVLRMGFGPWDWDMGLKTEMWASRNGFEGNGGGEEEGEGGENSPYVWKPLPCFPFNFIPKLPSQGTGRWLSKAFATIVTTQSCSWLVIICENSYWVWLATDDSLVMIIFWITFSLFSDSFAMLLF